MNQDGYYEIILIIDGKPNIVIVDDFIPVRMSNSNKPYCCFAKPNENELWVLLLEKAWAKINGGYLNIITGYTREAFEVLTGFGSTYYNILNLEPEKRRAIHKEIENAYETNAFISCSSLNEERIEKKGLIKSHAYSLLSVNKIIYDIMDIILYRLRNPWSHTEWTGDWSEKSQLWDDNTKKQVDFKDSDDGIFFISEKDFYCFFRSVEICYVLYNSTSLMFSVKEENHKDGSVFNLEVYEDGFLSVSVIRKNWRFHREIKDKKLPTFILVVKYDPNESNKLKIFSDFTGTSKLSETCCINKKVTKGNYLIYIYRDTDHAEFTPDSNMNIQIVCSSKCRYNQMQFDLREKGFPLLQNIIIQTAIAEKKYDINSGKDFIEKSINLYNSGLSYYIYYYNTQGNIYNLEGTISKIKNDYIMMVPYIKKDDKEIFHIKSPSQKYIVLIGLNITNSNNNDNFRIVNNVEKNKIDDNEVIIENNNDIDLTIYTNIDNGIKHKNFIRKVTKRLDDLNQDINYDIKFTNFEELEKNYEKYISLLKDIPKSNNNELKWGIMEVDNKYTYYGQFNGNKKEGIGVLINNYNIIVGEYRNDKLNGVGYTYNKEFKKLNRYNYVDDEKKGNGTIFYDNGKYEGSLKDGNRDGKGTYTFNDGDKYEGDWKNGNREGKGIYYYKNGNKYDGEWKEGKMHGKGIMYFKNGNKYEGDWVNDKKTGKGTLYLLCGDKYVGDWLNDEKTGKGIYYFVDGDKYEGDWKNDKKNGKGIYNYTNGNKYNGDWVNDQRIGKGIMYYKNGNKYEGDWVNGIKEGKGTLYLICGEKYEGDWKKDEKHGKGIYYFKNGSKYDGDWNNDNKEGKGTYYFVSGDKYEGDWKNNNMHGKGVYHYKNGNKYDGDWVNDDRTGKGIMYYKNGNKYEGDWNNDVREGKGVLIFYDGDKYEGDWKNDKKSGKGIYYYNDGDRFEGEWEDNKKNGKGTYYYIKSGNKRTGNYSDDKEIGEHTTYYPDGKMSKKNYENFFEI